MHRFGFAGNIAVDGSIAVDKKKTIVMGQKKKSSGGMSNVESCRECEVVFQDAAVMVLFKPAG